MFESSRFSTFAKPFHFPVWNACVLAASLFVFSGCARMQLKLGLKADLSNIPVTTMQASLPKSPDGIAPGDKSQLVVRMTDAQGKVYTTKGQGTPISWLDLKVTSAVVQVDQKGTVSLPDDPRTTDGKTGQISITVPSHPDLHAELTVPLRYDKKFTANYFGSRGMEGSNGQDGTNGLEGSPGSMDPNNPSPGGDGANGGDGTDGDNGGKGGDAPAVEVRVTLKDEGRPLLQVETSALGASEFFLVDPQGGSLTVDADGGSGGLGGKGGKGGKGGSGGIGSPNGHDGRDGLDGHDGLAGSQGKGGLITVTYDPKVEPYLSAIHLSAQYGPAPVFRKESLAPLW